MDMEPVRLTRCLQSKVVIMSLEKRVRDAQYFREKARRCRALSNSAIEPEVIEQLRMWSVDLADEADEAERRATELCEPTSPFHDG